MEKDIIENAKKYVNKLLLPLENHYYHHYNHALDVMQRAVYIAEKEWLSEDEIEILALSGLFHDTWFIIVYDKNESIWAKIAKNYLKSVLYPSEKIEQIEQIILATDPDYTNPKNIYEKIIKDADLDNLWRDDFLEKANDIKKEIETIKKIKIKDPNWYHGALDLLYKHNYFTKIQKKERWIKKEENKEILRQILQKIEEDGNKIKIEF